MIKEIRDSGAKIGGARKDKGIRKRDDLRPEDTAIAEKFLAANRDSIWPAQDEQGLLASGIPKGVAFWRERIRRSIPFSPGWEDKRAVINYIRVVQELRSLVEQIRDPKGVDAFYGILQQRYLEPSGDGGLGIIYQAKDAITDGLLKEARTGYLIHEKRARRSSHSSPDPGAGSDEDHHTEAPLQTAFLHTQAYRELATDDLSARAGIQESMYGTAIRTTADDEGPASVGYMPGGHTQKPPMRKKPFPLPAPASFERTGPAHLPDGCHICQQDLLALGFKGVEFGLWMSDADAQAAMDGCYNALCDLAYVLGIDKKDVSLGGTLSLSFGARGHGQSAAAYDPDHRTISLPNGNGAGFLAHAWAHALDDFLGRTCRMDTAHGPSFLSWAPYSSSVPRSMKDLFQTLRYKPAGLSPEQQARILKDRHERSVQKIRDRFWDRIQSITPGSLSLSAGHDGQRDAWDKAVQKAYDQRYSARLGMYSGSEGQNDAVEELSALHKRITGHVLPKQERSRLNYILADLYLTERSPIPSQERPLQGGSPRERSSHEHPLYEMPLYGQPSQTMPTDYLKNSQKMDERFARTQHGGHSSTCEMFARAFDCYVADKLKAGGISDPYLTAHAESFVFSDGDNGTIYAVPLGGEREQIRQRYDQMIRELKELVSSDRPDGIEKSPASREQGAGLYGQKTSITDIRNIVMARQGGMTADTTGRQGTSSHAAALGTRTH